MVHLFHMPIVGLFFKGAMLFNRKSFCAGEASCMEMRVIVNGRIQEGMNGDREAVDSGWWKWNLAGHTAICCGSLFQNVNDCDSSVCILIIVSCV